MENKFNYTKTDTVGEVRRATRQGLDSVPYRIVNAPPRTRRSGEVARHADAPWSSTWETLPTPPPPWTSTGHPCRRTAPTRPRHPCRPVPGNGRGDRAPRRGRVPQAAAYRPGGVSGRLPRLTRGWAVKARSRRPRPAPTDSRQHSPPAAVRTRSMRPAGASPPRCLAASRRRGRTRPCAGRAPVQRHAGGAVRLRRRPIHQHVLRSGETPIGRTTRRSKLDRNPCPVAFTSALFSAFHASLSHRSTPAVSAAPATKIAGAGQATGCASHRY